MSKLAYVPDRGDLIEINYQPAVGREVDKRRPAIVISPKIYNRQGGLCLVVPVTSNLQPGPFWIPMPAGFLSRPSLILCDKVASHDFRERSAVFLAKLPEQLVNDVAYALLDVVDPR